VIELLQIVLILLIAAGALVVVLTRDPVSQAVVISFYGLLLTILFIAFQAPDVALSQIVIGAVALPLMILLALAKIKKQAEGAENAQKK
jgi:energy-converting hydrogenase B subunit D